MASKELARAPYLLFIPDAGSNPHDEMMESIGAVDRTILVSWCARLNLLRSMFGSRGPFDTLLSARFFSGEQIRSMRAALKRAGRPRGAFLNCFNRAALLEVLRWVVLLGTDSEEETAELTLASAWHMIRAAHCARFAAFRRTLEAQAGPLLDKEQTADVIATYSLPIFAQMGGMQELMRKDRQVLGRSAILICEEFFAKNLEWKDRFETLVGMPLDAWIGCVLLAQRLTTGDLAPDPRTGLEQFGAVDVDRAGDLSADARLRFEAFLEQETQDLDALRESFLARLSDKTISTSTPFDTLALRGRPFLRLRSGAVMLCDRLFLEDKLWLGPVFRLLADGVSAALLFGALCVGTHLNVRKCHFRHC